MEASSDPRNLVGISGRKYRLLGELGYGYGKNICEDTYGNLFVVKLMNERHKQREIDVLSTAAKAGCDHFAMLYDYGSCPVQKQSFIVMEQLGRDLEGLMRQVASCGLSNGFTELTALRFISCDIKPENFVCGKDFPATGYIFIIDFGLSKRYAKDGVLIPMKKSSIGTAQFMSLAQHERSIPTRFDDLEGWFYTFLYLLNGELPWSRFDKTERQRLFKAKQALREQPVISRKFSKMMRRILQLIDEHPRNVSPNYNAFYDILERKMAEVEGSYDLLYDWEHLGNNNNMPFYGYGTKK